METFFQNRNDKIPIMEFGISQERFHNVIYNTEAIRTNIAYEIKTVPPDHFGYENYTSFGNYNKNPTYFLLNDIGRNFYSYVYPEYRDKWRFTQDDFSRLEEDSGVQIIYRNGNLDIYLTKSI